MKKLLCILLMIMLSFSCAHASGLPEFPFTIPVPDEKAEDTFPPKNSPSESLIMEIDGRSIAMSFDPSADYSYIENGIAQASFFAYSDNDEYLYEAYFVFPENVSAGTTVTPEYAISSNVQECSVTLIISDNATETYYWALQMNGAPYPQGADYAIRFDSVTKNASGITYSGELSATLVDVDMVSGKTNGSLVIRNAPFSFTMPAGASAPQVPAPQVPAPAATPTVRPDMFRI